MEYLVSILTGISETPAPAFYKQMTERPTANGISYNPSLGFVPELTLPDNLPELDNYATFDDNTTIEWTKQQMASIATVIRYFDVTRHR